MRICQPPENVSVGFVKSVLPKSEAVEHLRHAQVDAVAFLAPEEIRELVIPDEQRLVFALGERRVGEVVLDAIDLGLGLEQRREGERRLVEQRASGMVEPVLRQIADGERRGADDRAAVRLVEAGEHPEQRRLAGAVGPASPTRSPSVTCQVTSSSRTRSPKAFVRA